MSEMKAATAGTQVAIEFLTLWLEPDRQRAAAQIPMALRDPERPGAVRIIAGQCDLGMILVLELAKAQGAEDLHARAGEILRELSWQLPE